jgi:hypothetical protein
MSTTPTARNHLAELIALEEVITEMQIESRYVASIQHAHMCAANTRAEFGHFVNDSATKKVAKPTTGTKPCK